MKISILDCTLRDGGYINDFNFTFDKISYITEKLCETGIEIIECGFLQSGKNDSEYSLYGSVDRIMTLSTREKQMFVAMIAYGEICADEIVPYRDSYIDGIRLTFHNSEWENTKKIASDLMNKGYKIFIQPVSTNSYMDEELIALIKEVNKLNPYAFYIVDTLGSMYKNDILRKFYLVEHNLNKGIGLGLHSHNNMQMSFANAISLLEVHTDRHIIIDSSVFGMGRGAGNLNTELIAHYINTNIEERYNLVPLLEVIDDAILPIYKCNPWGFSEPYYLSAIMGIHPNYATYLVDKQSVGMTTIFEMLNKLPSTNRHLFVKNEIETIYHDEMSNVVEDSEAIKILSAQVHERPILVIAPGNSVKCCSEHIMDYIEKINPFIITLNFVPDNIKPNLVFVSNRKRYSQLECVEYPIAVTSNIRVNGLKGVYVINYDSLLQESSDSSGIIVLRFLLRLSVNQATLAGYDGFTSNSNHYHKNIDSLLSAESIKALNNSMSRQLSEINRKLRLSFLTSSAYEVDFND